MPDDVLPQSGLRPRRGGFLRRNLFAIWGALMLIGGVARLVMGDLTGFVGVGLGMAFLLIDGVGRATTGAREQGARR